MILKRPLRKLLDKALSSEKTKKLIYFLDSLNLIPSSFKKKIIFRGIFKVKVSPGVSFKMVGYGGGIENHTFRSGLFKTWEVDVGWIWKELCQISQVIFDIGANIGIYSLTARALNKNCQIYAFEPSLRNFKKLNENVRINNYHIISEQLAISNTTGKSVFYDTPYEHETSASLSPNLHMSANGLNKEIIQYEVETIKLSDYILQKSIDRLDLIKLDIELHEFEAIEGLGKYLLQLKPIILVEVLRIETAVKLNSFFNLPDYKIFHLKASQKAEEVTEFKIYSTANRERNYLIFHKSLEERIREKTLLYHNLTGV